MEDDDMFGQGTGEARDSISTLPRKIAIQVSVYMRGDVISNNVAF